MPKVARAIWETTVSSSFRHDAEVIGHGADADKQGAENDRHADHGQRSFSSVQVS